MDEGTLIRRPWPRAGRTAQGAARAVLVIAASLFLTCPEIAAKDKEGARLEVTYRDGHRASRRVVGELIAVKADSLLLVEEYSEFDRSIAVRDILSVRIKHKSQGGTWALYGGAAGLLAGVLGVASSGRYDDEDRPGGMFVFGAIGAGIGAAVGLIAGTMASIGETFVFKGRPESEVKAMLDRLNAVARVRDFR